MIPTWPEKLARLRDLTQTTSVEGQPETYGWVDDFRSEDSFALRGALDRLDRCVALLKGLEWSGDSGWDDGEHVCPECRGEEPRGRAPDRDIGHRPDCDLAALLAP